MAFDALGGEGFQIEEDVENAALIGEEVLKGRRQGKRGSEFGYVGEERKHGCLKPLDKWLE